MRSYYGLTHLVKRSLARDDARLDAVTDMRHTVLMSLSPRDRHILRLVAGFNQASTGQVAALCFPTALSRTSYDNVLARLCSDGYLYRIDKRRRSSSARGGSGENVYMLGSLGWNVCGFETRWHRRAVDDHTLAIVDAFVQLVQRERLGGIRIARAVNEPDCHQVVAGVHLKPDLYVELERDDGRTLALWIEIDMGTQRPARIDEKLSRYIHVWDSGHVSPFPRVVFVAPDAERAAELATMITQRQDDERRLFASVEIASFPQF